MARRIANVVMPSSSLDIFAKLRAKAARKYGPNNLGMASDPRIIQERYLASNLPELPSTLKLQKIQKQSTFQTRDDMVRQGVGLPSLGMPGQPAPMPGRATAAQMAGAGELGGTIGDSAYVEDADWQVSLSQILGQSALTQEQLQAASYANVRSLLGGTGDEAWKDEMTYYLQRMVLEGYAHGVDLVREIQSGGGTLDINPRYWGDGYLLGCSYSNNVVEIASDRWGNFDDATKLTILYHELGHELLQRGDFTGGIMTYDYFGADAWVHDNYQGMVDSLFNGAVNTSGETPGTALTQDQINQMIAANPGWYPSVTGAAPGGPGTTTPTTTTTTTTTNNYKLIPPTVTPWSGNAGSVGGTGGARPKPAEPGKTPVAGVLPDMNAVLGFAAGLADATGKSASTFDQALARFRAG